MLIINEIIKIFVCILEFFSLSLCNEYFFLSTSFVTNRCHEPKYEYKSLQANTFLVNSYIFIERRSKTKPFDMGN